jgi:hypothetical protein
MMTDAASIAFLLKALGYGIPAAILAFGFLVFRLQLTYQTKKQDKDRREHMEKWESMVAIQDRAIASNKETTTEILSAHKEELNRLMETHQEEISRQFALQERQAAAIEAITHQVTVLANTMANRHHCPNQG